MTLTLFLSLQFVGCAFCGEPEQYTAVAKTATEAETEAEAEAETETATETERLTESAEAEPERDSEPEPASGAALPRQSSIDFSAMVLAPVPGKF